PPVAPPAPPARPSGLAPSFAPPAAPAPPAPAPSPAPSLPAAPDALHDDILGSGPTVAYEPPQDPYFRQVYDQFIAVKKSCNEPISGLTFEKFTEKLVRNRDDLRAKTGCREVRFTVYVKDGKAALKATPVKDEA
ncbi:MAG: MXAN_5187 C-terminal domain-containing protein, partial [Kofleriaceae bacterium]